MKYVHTYTDRHGHTRHYFRRGSAQRIPLPDPGASDFQAAYSEAMARVAETESTDPLPPFERHAPAEPALDDRGPTAGVYLLMQGKRVVYVGSSSDMVSRVSAHRHTGREFDRAYYISIPDAEQRTHLEWLLISALGPEQNHAGIRPGTLD